MLLDITSYIPQRAPIIMVGNVIEYQPNKVVTSFKITKDNIFCENGQFQECGLIENIAQSAAAMEGCRAQNEGSPVKIGFIGSVKNLKVDKKPSIGDVITTTVEVTNNVMGINIISGVIAINEEQIASATMNIFLQED